MTNPQPVQNGPSANMGTVIDIMTGDYGSLGKQRAIAHAAWLESEARCEVLRQQVSAMQQHIAELESAIAPPVEEPQQTEDEKAVADALARDATYEPPVSTGDTDAS